MELIISFVAGATIAAIVAVLLSRAVIRNHKVQEAKLLPLSRRAEAEVLERLAQYHLQGAYGVD